MTTTPTSHRVSVVVASNGPAADVAACLDTLVPQARERRFEVIVAHAGPEPALASIVERYSDVSLLLAPATATIPELRALGAERARAPLLALSEAGARFPGGWAVALLEAVGDDCDAVGGAIDPDPTLGLVDFAAHVCEYGAFTTPVRGGPDREVSAFHVCYRMSLWRACDPEVRRRHWETVLHVEMRRRGGRFCLDGGLRLLNGRSYGFGEFVRQRFRYGKDYGRIRTGRIPRLAHGMLLILTAGLPALMLVRYARWILTRRLSRRRAVAALPLMAIFATSWSLGEWYGYWLGLRPANRQP